MKTTKVFTKLLVVCLFSVGIPTISFGASFPSEFGPRESVPGLEGLNHLASYITPDGQRMLTTVWITDWGPCYMRETTCDPIGKAWTTPHDLGFPSWAGYHTLSPDQSAMYYGFGPWNDGHRRVDTDGDPSNDVDIPALPPREVEFPLNFAGQRAYFALYDDPTAPSDSVDIGFCTYAASDPVNGFGAIAPVAEINTGAYIERHPYVTPDHNVLLFASNRPGGYGGLDIWKAVWNNSLNRWDNVENLGPNINTPSDEVLPFYCPETRTLYFTWARGFADNLLMQAVEECPEPPSHEPWSFVHIADPQLSHPADNLFYFSSPLYLGSREWFSGTIYKINNCSTIPDFILVSGDIAEYGWWFFGTPQPATWNYTDFSDALESLNTEIKDNVYIIPGNHDGYVYMQSDSVPPNWTYYLHSYKGYIDESLFDFRDYRPYNWAPLGYGLAYEFLHKDFLFIGLDTDDLDNDDSGILQFQVEKLSDLDRCTPKIIFMHHPPVKTGGPINDEAEDFVDYCKGNSVQLVLAGHTHKNFILDENGEAVSPNKNEPYPQFIQTSSAGNAWWSGDPSFQIVKVINNEAYPQAPTVTTVFDCIIAKLFSPANLHVYDSSWNHVGISGSSSVDRSISNSFYFSHKETPEFSGIVLPEEIIIFEAAYDGYLYEVIGTEEDEYSLEITLKNGGEDIVFKAADIPTLPGAVHDYTIDWDVLDIGGEGVTVKIDADGDGTFERSITADSELTAFEFRGVPVADAGPDQTVEQSSYYGAEVTLDGSGSTDPESTPGTNDDIVLFDWYEGVTLLGSGEIFDYTFGIGEHIVTLVVADSKGAMDEDEVIIDVTGSEPSASQLWIFPTVILRDIGDWEIMAMVRLPEGVTKAQIDLDQPLLLYPGEIEATRQYAIQWGGRWRPRTTIFSYYDKSELMDAIPDDGYVELEVVGKLNTGQWFYGSDSVRIISWCWWTPWWEYLLDYSD